MSGRTTAVRCAILIQTTDLTRAAPNTSANPAVVVAVPHTNTSAALLDCRIATCLTASTTLQVRRTCKASGERRATFILTQVDTLTAAAVFPLDTVWETTFRPTMGAFSTLVYAGAILADLASPARLTGASILVASRAFGTGIHAGTILTRLARVTG